MKTKDKTKNVKLQQRNQSIDLIKGLCILFVIITHFSWTNKERLGYGFPFIIDMAVPIFMLISGYVNSKSYQRKNIETLRNAFSVKNWLKSFIRYTIPYLTVFFVETIICIAFTLTHNTQWGEKKWYEYFTALLTGGWGPGSYYYPILLQFLIIFPLIFILIKKYKEKGLILCFLINLYWEFLKIPLSVSSGCYRLLIFRYIFLIAFGCYVGLYGTNKKLNLISLAGAIIGLIFIITTQYTNYNPFIFTQWTTTSLPAILFVIPIFNIIVTKIKKLPNFFKPIEIIGRASYHIFLAQMVFFNFFSFYLLNLIGTRSLALFVDVGICLVIGLLFYFAETISTNCIINKIHTRKNSK